MPVAFPQLGKTPEVNVARATIVIVGSGIAGTFASIMLGRQGHRVIVCERRSHEETISPNFDGRTINFTLSDRGRHCLARIGLLEQALKQSVQLYGRLIHFPRTRLRVQYQYGSRNNDLLHSISRADLHSLLMEKALETGTVEFRFDHGFTGVDLESETAKFKTKNGDSVISFDLLIGADGTNSAVRCYFQGIRLVSAAVDESEWRYTEERSRVHAESDLNFLHVWPNWNSVVCGLPLPTGDLVLNRLFRIARNQDPIGFPVRRIVTDTWYVGHSVILIGDAAHAMSPFLGQGMNLAMEDALVLGDMLSACPISTSTLARFQNSRKPIADELSGHSEDHFLTLSRRMLNPASLIKRKLKVALESKFPIIAPGDQYNDWTKSVFESVR